MKKTILTLFTFSCFLISNAQISFNPGIRVGMNISDLTNTNLDTKSGFYVAVYGALKLSKLYTFQPELGYSQQGAKGTIQVQQYNYTTSNYVSTPKNVEYEFNYFTTTIANKFSFLNDRIYVLVGPTVDFMVSSNLDSADTVFFDVGITGGVGVTIVKGLSADIRLKKGFITTMNDDLYVYDEQDNTYYYDTIDDDSWKTNLVFQFGLAYTFDFKK